MRIAQVSPLTESVPPLRYGGTERIVSSLTEELVRLGHEVTLFASGDSTTSANLVPCAPQALRAARCRDPLAMHVYEVEQVFQRIHDFDFIHFHIDHVHYPLLRRHRIPHVTTLHGRLDWPATRPLLHEFADEPMVSISDAQRLPLPELNWRRTVYHGIPPDLYRFNRRHRGDYLVFVGRIAPEKGPDRAIQIAERAGLSLVIAAKVSGHEEERFFKDVIKPKLGPKVEFLGEIDDVEKNEIVGNAKALIFPIDWPEPFGLVMIESMACGTPVIAFDRGAVPEVIDEGLTGTICNGIDDAVEAVKRIDQIDRATCRAMFERRFSAARMTRDYVDVYEHAIQEAASWTR